MDVPLLSAVDLTCGYGRAPVLHSVSLDLRPGDFLGVVGPNGCGKSTLIRGLTGILKATSGEALLQGENVRSLPRRTVARRIAVIPQDTVPLFGFTVIEMVLMGRSPHLGRLQRAGERDISLAHEALRQTDLYDLRHRKFSELSGGERQRAVIARALAQQPVLLLLDEPDSHLDIGHQIQLFDLLDNLNRTRKLALLCVSHNINLGCSYCHRLMLMQRGRVVATGPPADIVTPRSIRELYGVEAVVQASPVNGSPLVVPRALGKSTSLAP